MAFEHDGTNAQDVKTELLLPKGAEISSFIAANDTGKFLAQDLPLATALIVFQDAAKTKKKAILFAPRFVDGW